jgi:site-specific DNA-cytosine methylase
MLNCNIKREKITYIDLFAAAGGTSQGFENIVSFQLRGRFKILK